MSMEIGGDNEPKACLATSHGSADSIEGTAQQPALWAYLTPGRFSVQVGGVGPLPLNRAAAVGSETLVVLEPPYVCHLYPQH